LTEKEREKNMCEILVLVRRKEANPSSSATTA